MNYKKIIEAFSKQPNEFLQAAVPKLKEDISKALSDKDYERARLSKRQLEAVKDVLISRH